MNILRAENIVLGYSNKVLVQSFSFTLKSGNVVGLLGLNGSGKTTFFKSLLGGISLLGGDVFWNDRSINLMKPLERQKIFSWLSARRFIEEKIKVFEVLYFSAPRLNETELNLIVEMLALSPLLEKPYHELSEGQKKKVELGSVLLKNTPVVLLDEPSVFFDFLNQQELLVIINMLKEQGKIVVVSSHALDFITRCCNQCWQIQNNTLKQYTSVKEAITEYTKISLV